MLDIILSVMSSVVALAGSGMICRFSWVMVRSGESAAAFVGSLRRERLEVVIEASTGSLPALGNTTTSKTTPG